MSVRSGVSGGSDLVKDIISTSKEPDSDELDSFKNLVNDWFKYDDQILKLSIAIKERKNYQRALNTKIQDFMIKYNYNDLNTEHGRIKSNVKEISLPIKISDIKSKILKHNDLSGEELFNIIFNEEREKIIKKNIKRVIPKVSLTL
jgi:hypothetical protein